MKTLVRSKSQTEGPGNLGFFKQVLTVVEVRLCLLVLPLPGVHKFELFPLIPIHKGANPFKTSAVLTAQSRLFCPLGS